MRKLGSQGDAEVVELVPESDHAGILEGAGRVGQGAGEATSHGGCQGAPAGIVCGSTGQTFELAADHQRHCSTAVSQARVMLDHRAVTLPPAIAIFGIDQAAPTVLAWQIDQRSDRDRQSLPARCGDRVLEAGVAGGEHGIGCQVARSGGAHIPGWGQRDRVEAVRARLQQRVLERRGRVHASRSGGDVHPELQRRPTPHWQAA